MAAIVRTNRGDSCTICCDNFLKCEPKFSHVGGGNHDGFHSQCLRTWIRQNPTCPFDRQPVNPNSPMLLIERVMAGSVNAAYAAFFGIAVAAVAGAVGARAVGARAAAGVVVAAAGAVAAGGAAAGAVVAGAGAAAAGVAAGAAGAGVAAVAAGAVIGLGIERILIRRGVDAIARENIGLGMYLGGVAAGIGGIVLNVTPITAIATIALVGGCAAGVLSLTRK